MIETQNLCLIDWSRRPRSPIDALPTQQETRSFLYSFSLLPFNATGTRETYGQLLAAWNRFSPSFKRDIRAPRENTTVSAFIEMVEEAYTVWQEQAEENRRCRQQYDYGNTRTFSYRPPFSSNSPRQNQGNTNDANQTGGGAPRQFTQNRNYQGYNRPNYPNTTPCRPNTFSSLTFFLSPFFSIILIIH